MGTEPGYLSSHTAVAGSSLAQTSPHLQAVNGETSITAGTLMSINPTDGKAYKCGLNTIACLPAGFAATDSPLDTTVDDTTKVTLVRQGRIKGFSGLIPGALYYPSADTAGAIVPERGMGGPAVTAVDAETGSGFLRNVHIRAGHRPKAGDWAISFTSATTCTVTPPGGSASAATTVADSTAYNGTIIGAEDFYIETASLTSGDEATITVSYSAAAAIVPTLDSGGNAFTTYAPIGGMAGIVASGMYTLTTSSNTVTAAFNGGSASAAVDVAADTSYFGLIPGFALTTETSSVTDEANRFLVSAQSPAPPVGIAVDSTTLQIMMGGIG